MGVMNYLVSDSTKEWFEFGKILWNEEKTAAMKHGEKLEEVVYEAIQDSSFNIPRAERAEAMEMADRAATWMRAHPDWRSLSDAEPEFDDVFLADTDGDAEDYLAEVDDPAPVYMKTGSVWGVEDEES